MTAQPVRFDISRASLLPATSAARAEWLTSHSLPPEGVEVTIGVDYADAPRLGLTVGSDGVIRADGTPAHDAARGAIVTTYRAHGVLPDDAPAVYGAAVYDALIAEQVADAARVAAEQATHAALVAKVEAATAAGTTRYPTSGSYRYIVIPGLDGCIECSDLPAPVADAARKVATAAYRADEARVAAAQAQREAAEATEKAAQHALTGQILTTLGLPLLAAQHAEGLLGEDAAEIAILTCADVPAYAGRLAADHGGCRDEDGDGDDVVTVRVTDGDKVKLGVGEYESLVALRASIETLSAALASRLAPVASATVALSPGSLKVAECECDCGADQRRVTVVVVVTVAKPGPEGVPCKWARRVAV